MSDRQLVQPYREYSHPVPFPYLLLRRLLMFLADGNFKEAELPFVMPSPWLKTRAFIESLKRANRRDVINFRLVDRRFNSVYTSMFCQISKIYGVYTIFDTILEHLVPMANELMSPNHRASLSIESFSSAAPQPQESSSQISNFRLVCSRFAEEGASRRFVRVKTRFTSKSLLNLLYFSQRPHIAKAVKQFSYMVPRFYPQGMSLIEKQERVLNMLEASRFKELLAVDLRWIDRETIRMIMEISNDQITIINNQIDRESLLCAFKKFTNLQHIRIMKVVNQWDEKYARFLMRNPQYEERFRPAQITESWSRAAGILSLAIQELKYPIRRFSSRFMDPPTPLVLTQNTITAISRFIGQLRYLEQEFVDDRETLAKKMVELLPLFFLVFKAAAETLQGLHIGFALRASVSIESVFQKARFERLKYFGIHNWYFNGEEIIGLLDRHKDTLESIRFRNVSLREGMWKHVLEFIRLNMRLKWISLRRIGYGLNPLPPPPAIGGMPPPPPWAAILENLGDIESVSDSIYWDGETSQGTAASDQVRSLDENGDDDSEGSSDALFHQEDDPESDIEELRNVTLDEAVPGLEMEEKGKDVSNYGNTIKLFCECQNGYAFDDLGDNGIIVDKAQWKRWERWAVQKCIIHDPKL